MMQVAHAGLGGVDACTGGHFVHVQMLTRTHKLRLVATTSAAADDIEVISVDERNGFSHLRVTAATATFVAPCCSAFVLLVFVARFPPLWNGNAFEAIVRIEASK